MNENAGIKLLAEGLSVLLEHHANQDQVATPESKKKAHSVLDKLKHFDWEVGKPVYPEDSNVKSA